MDTSRKVVIIGAGQVGAAFAYALMIKGTATQIVIVDQDVKRAEGHVMDLNHGLAFVQPARITVGDYADCKDAAIVAVTAGGAQKPGDTRLDLVRKNAEMLKDMIPRIVEHEPRILLMVSNPVDVLTYVASKLSGYPPGRVLGSGTTLDTARFRYVLSEQCRIDPRNVHAYVVGEHGDSEVAVWSGVNIGSVQFDQYCLTCPVRCSRDERDALFDRVRNAAYEIIARKGATNFAIGLAMVRISESILRDENSVLTVSTLVNDYHGISDVCLSVPAIVNHTGVSRILTLDLDPSEIQQLQHSADVLKGVIRDLSM